MRSEASTASGSIASRSLSSRSSPSMRSAPSLQIDADTADARTASPGLHHSGSTTLKASEEQARYFVELVEQRCGFLRLTGHKLYANSTKSSRVPGIAWIVQFYVHGLPSAKRNRWQQPLFRSVAALLSQSGCSARVQRGKLIVDIQEGVSLCVDFAPGTK